MSLSLITGAVQAKAHALKNKMEGKFILGDFHDLPEFMLADKSMYQLPHPSSTSYVHEMLKFCLDKEVSVIFPLHNEEIQQLNDAQQLFGEFDIEIKAVP